MGKLFEYYEKGMNLIGKGLRAPHPLYKAIFMEKLVKSSEKLLGELDEDSRIDVEAAYTFGTGLLGAGIYTGNYFFYVASALTYSLGALHHSTISELLKKKKQLEKNSEFEY